MFPTPPEPPVRRRSRFYLLSALAAAAGLALACLSVAPAAGPGSSDGLALGAAPTTSDVLLARAALAALDADPQFRDVNLLVSVVDRVAVVGGPVPSPEIGRRAVQIIRERVPALADVNNRCFVQTGPDPLIRAMAASLPATPRRPLATELPAVVASPKTGRVEDLTFEANDTAFAAVDTGSKTVVARRPANPGENVLLPPVAQAAPPTPAGTPTMLAATSQKPGAVFTAVEAVRRSDRRFSGLSAELRGDTLVIAGTASGASDAWDFAQQLRRIPGVARVVVGSVTR